MSQQEGASVAALGHEQTRITTRTGADHAYAMLTYRNRLAEYERWFDWTPPPGWSGSTPPLYDDPFVDNWLEHDVDLREDFEGTDPLFIGMTGPDGPLFPVSDPRRFVQGLNITDETGKLNLNFASIGALSNMLGAGFVVGEVKSEGGVYPQVNLVDASFLDPYDNGGRTGSYIVIDSHLFKYASRRGNALFEVTPNPVYNGIGGVNAIFNWWSPSRQITNGQYVTTPTPYKIMLYRLLRGSGGTPAWFNHVGDVRRIAELPRLVNPDPNLGPDVMGLRLDGWPEGIDPVTYQVLEDKATAICPAPRFDGGWFYPSVVTFGEMTREGESGLEVLTVRYDHRQAFQSDYDEANDPRRAAPG
jgi:hypothetical protein